MRKDILPQWMECLFYIIFSLHLCKIDIGKFSLFMLDSFSLEIPFNCSFIASIVNITKSKTIMKTEKRI